MTLRLRPYRAGDEAAALAAHEAMRAEGFDFILLAHPMDWAQFLTWNDGLRHGLHRSEHWVRGVQLAAVDGDELVGRVSLRFELSDFLARWAGHVGYGVLPAHRKKGYASEMLHQALIVLRAEGVDAVLVTCDDANAASARVIERNGGVLESVVEHYDGPGRIRRYWIE